MNFQSVVKKDAIGKQNLEKIERVSLNRAVCLLFHDKNTAMWEV